MLFQRQPLFPDTHYGFSFPRPSLCTVLLKDELSLSFLTTCYTGLLLLIYSSNTTRASPSLSLSPCSLALPGGEAKEYGVGELFSETCFQIQGRRCPSECKLATLV